jgi:hypothetical protein
MADLPDEDALALAPEYLLVDALTDGLAKPSGWTVVANRAVVRP